MPAIKYKKKTYAGATFPVLELTKAEYDALPDAKKMDGTVYMITDDDGGWEAERSTYDNTESGLIATNVQDALDEINSKKTAYPPITTRVVDLYYTGQYCGKDCPSVSGYKAICVGGFRSIGDASVGNNIFDMYVDYGQQQLKVSFTKSFSSTAGVSVWIVYVVDKS